MWSVFLCIFCIIAARRQDDDCRIISRWRIIALVEWKGKCHCPGFWYSSPSPSRKAHNPISMINHSSSLGCVCVRTMCKQNLHAVMKWNILSYWSLDVRRYERWILPSSHLIGSCKLEFHSTLNPKRIKDSKNFSTPTRCLPRERRNHKWNSFTRGSLAS